MDLMSYLQPSNMNQINRCQIIQISGSMHEIKDKTLSVNFILKKYYPVIYPLIKIQSLPFS